MKRRAACVKLKRLLLYRFRQTSLSYVEAILPRLRFSGGCSVLDLRGKWHKNERRDRGTTCWSRAWFRSEIVASAVDDA